MRRNSLTLALVALIASAAWLAPQAARSAEIFEFYTGVRQLGMGGAYTGVVNDETALLTNPAGLGKLRDMTITIADPELHGSFNDTGIARIGDVVKITDPTQLKTLLDENRGKHWHLKGQVFPSIVGPNVGFGIHRKVSYDAEMNADGTTFRYDYTSDYAIALGYCFRFFSGIMKVGWAVRAVDRAEIHKDFDTASTTDYSANSNVSAGLGIAGDVGLVITAPVAMLPTLSAVLRDAGGTNYNLTDGSQYSSTTRPERTPQKLDGALSFFPIISNHVRTTFTFEYHDILTASEELDSMKRLHAGLEFNFADFFFLRGGMNQRYWTAGIELASERFQLQAASYGEEIGTATAAGITPKEDRRFVGKFAIRF